MLFINCKNIKVLVCSVVENALSECHGIMFCVFEELSSLRKIRTIQHKLSGI